MLSEADQKRIGEAIRAAEAQTSGEIVCVLARSSSDYSAVPVLWASLLALAAPWPMVALTSWSVLRIFSIQALVFIVASLLFSLPGVRALLVPGAVKRIRAHRAAMEQFFARGLTRTRMRRGLMIFVSYEEHYIRIVADEGVSAVVADAEWKPAVEALAAAIRDGQFVVGFEDAIRLCAGVLSRHFPPVEGADELPDKIYVV